MYKSLLVETWAQIIRYFYQAKHLQDIQSTDTQSMVLVLILQFFCMHKTSHTPSVCPSLAIITSRSKSITSSKFLGIKECLNT